MAQRRQEGLRQGRRSVQEGDRTEARRAEAYNGLASVYTAQRKFDEASAAAKKAAELTATAVRAAPAAIRTRWYNQGVILCNAGKMAEAKTQFQKAIAAKPDHAEAHYQLGMALVNEGNLGEAVKEFETYLKLAPTARTPSRRKTP